jgi:hypothetical protein
MKTYNLEVNNIDYDTLLKLIAQIPEMNFDVKTTSTPTQQTTFVTAK